jgi:eukaryotic-like serine/threonine-protein kinase
MPQPRQVANLPRRAPTIGASGVDKVAVPRTAVRRAPGAAGPYVAPGVILGDAYRVERPLAEGGMSIVLLARFIPSNKRVAIKILKPEMLQDTNTTARFAREARTIMRLRHKHAVGIVDASEDAVFGPFIAMDYLDGRDLRAVLQQGPIEVSRAVDITLQLCSVLHHAHALGIVHRDIKPENVFIQTDGAREIVKLLDFGISKLSPKAVQGRAESHAVLTSELLGSPPYMAPEQLRASTKVDQRCDVWGVGATLYELLASRAPFRGATFAELCANILTMQPEPLEVVDPAVPARLARVVDRCLAKDAVGRIPNMAELAHALAPFASPQGLLALEDLPRPERIDARKSAQTTKILPQKLEPALPLRESVASARALPREGSQRTAGIPIFAFVGPAILIAVAGAAFAVHSGGAGVSNPTTQGTMNGTDLAGSQAEPPAIPASTAAPTAAPPTIDSPPTATVSPPTATVQSSPPPTATGSIATPAVPTVSAALRALSVAGVSATGPATAAPALPMQLTSSRRNENGVERYRTHSGATIRP